MSSGPAPKEQPEPAGDQPAPDQPAPDQPAGGRPHSGADEPAATGPAAGQVRSGLRNPAAAVRGLGATTLLLEAITLLLAIAPLRMLGGPYAGWGVVAVIVLAVVAVVLAAFLRHRITWYLVGALNLAVVLSGYFQWSLAVIGVAFALVWWYVLHVRRTILSP
ncbi:MAG: DUF4233 domain-containing protein [Micromonosporaceae bacterium]